MGISMLVGLEIPLLSRGTRMDLSKMRRGPAGAFPLGMAFAFSWTPCVGPVLAALLTYAGATGSLARGAGLLFVYSVGLGVAFVATALLYTRAYGSSAWLPARHRHHANGWRPPDRDGRAAPDGELAEPVRAGSEVVRQARLAADLRTRRLAQCGKRHWVTCSDRTDASPQCAACAPAKPIKARTAITSAAPAMECGPEGVARSRRTRRTSLPSKLTTVPAGASATPAIASATNV